MKALLVNYCYRPEWVKNYDLDYLIYDRSDDGQDWLFSFPENRIIQTSNVGNVDYDKLSFLVDHYDNLPDVFLWGKSNLFKYITETEFKEIMAQESHGFTPLLSKGHPTYRDRLGTVCYYENQMYHERNDSWYLHEQPAKYFPTFHEWAKEFQLPDLPFIPFAPGGNYILTRETVHKYSRDLYDKMRQTMDYCQLPGEAQLAERSYYLLWR